VTYLVFSLNNIFFLVFSFLFSLIALHELLLFIIWYKCFSSKYMLYSEIVIFNKHRNNYLNMLAQRFLLIILKKNREQIQNNIKERKNF